jgi:hypothetical protein
MFISFLPFILALESNSIDFSFLSISTPNGMRSLFRIKVNVNEFLIHIFWHFNWQWCKKNTNCIEAESALATQAHMIELKQQLPEAVKTDDIGRMKSSGIRHHTDTPEIIPQPHKKRKGGKRGNSSTLPN